METLTLPQAAPVNAGLARQPTGGTEARGDSFGSEDLSTPENLRTRLSGSNPSGLADVTIQRLPALTPTAFGTTPTSPV